jgi:spermidine synthase
VHNAALHCMMARTLRRHYAHVVSFSTHVPAFDTEWAFLACSDRIDLARLDAKAIDAYCARLTGENFFYDSVTHRRLFSLPLYLRRMLAAGGDTF